MANLLALRAQAELLLRQRKGSLAPPTLVEFVNRLWPDYRWNWHHQLIAEYLERVLDGSCPRLVVSMPPRHGKTQLISRLFPAYALGRDPDLSVISCSYAASLATRNAREVQRLLADPRYRALFPGTRLPGPRDVGYTRTVDWFEIAGRRGSFRAAGVGGGITGLGFRLGIVDDPVKDRLSAESVRLRESTWDWWTSVFRTRAETGAAIVVVSTRWHHDDLVGRLLREEGGWEVLSLPALAEGELHPKDPRQPGEALWPERYPAEELEQIRQLSPYDWASLYQQRPIPREGGMIRADWIRPAPDPDTAVRRVWAWDLAAKATGDWSAGVLLTETGTGYHVQWVVRLRADYPEIRRQVLSSWTTAPADALLVEDAAAGIPLVAELRSSTSLPVIPVKPRGAKVSRVAAVAPLFEAGRVTYSAGAPWASEFLAELAGFPSWPSDDQVDAIALALGWLAHGRLSLDYVKGLFL